MSEAQTIALDLLRTAGYDGEGSLWRGRTLAESPGGVLPGWPWINYATGYALERRGLVTIEKHHSMDGPDAIKLVREGR